jgi:hypothetical protein
VVPRPQAQAQPRTAQDSGATATLIEDLDVFAKSFEKQQEESLRAEAAERQRKEDEIRRWAEAEEKRRQAFEREREAKTGITQAGGRKSAALDLMKKKLPGGSADPAGAANNANRLEAIARIDARLRAAFRYLAEFTTVLNEAKPVSEARQGVMFFGDRAGMILGDGFTDLRTRDVGGKSCADYLIFTYRVRFPKPEKLEVSGQETQRVLDRLKSLGIKHEVSGEKDPLGQLTRASIVMAGPFPCQAVLRADYDEPGYTMELMNVRHHGPAKLRLAPEELNDDVLDEFGTWVLGASDAFERFLKRRA